MNAHAGLTTLSVVRSVSRTTEVFAVVSQRVRTLLAAELREARRHPLSRQALRDAVHNRRCNYERF